MQEEVLAMALRLSPYPISLTDVDTDHCLVINSACLKAFGFCRNEVVGRKTLLSTMWPDHQERDRLIGLLKSKRSTQNLDVPIRVKNGSLRRFQLSSMLVKLRNRRCLLTIYNDITDHKLAEETLQRLTATLEQQVAERTDALRKSEERFRTFLDNAPNLAFMKGPDGRYLYANRRFEEAFQLDQKDFLGKTDEELFPPEQAEQYHAHDRRVLDSGQSMEFEEDATYTDGRHTSIAVRFPVRDGMGRIYATGGIVIDITSRKKAEEELRQSQEELRQHRAQLQDLTSKLIAAQDHERQRIARDLHDDLSQRMASLVLDIAALEEHPSLVSDAILHRLKSVREQLEQLADDLHSLAYNLHPSLLMHAGLQPAIEDHIQQVAARTGLRILAKTRRVPPALSLDQSICLFRVLQESLQNIVKHAKATAVTVRLSGSSKGVGLSVSDNGKGFTPGKEILHHKGLGLISMQERLRLLNGFLNIHSRVAEGTKVCAWLPFKREAL